MSNDHDLLVRLTENVKGLSNECRDAAARFDAITTQLTVKVTDLEKEDIKLRGHIHKTMNEAFAVCKKEHETKYIERQKISLERIGLWITVIAVGVTLVLSILYN